MPMSNKKLMKGREGGANMMLMMMTVLLLFNKIQLSMSAFLPTATTTNSRHAFIHRSSFITTTSNTPSNSPLSTGTSTASPTSTTSTTVPTVNTRTTLSMSDDASPATPTSFREAEVLGLKFMQEGNYEDALKAFQQGLRCPGSRQDVIRTKSLSGPSPVGGSMGGYESQNINTLDEFEMQAAHYNMACAHAQLGNASESVANLQIAFQQGFDNYATVRNDPDLSSIRSTPQFEKLMQQYDPSKKNNNNLGGGFNPFGLFGSGGSK